MPTILKMEKTALEQACRSE